MPYKHHVSHNSKDKPAIEAIARLLQQGYGLQCWLGLAHKKLDKAVFAAYG